MVRRNIRQPVNWTNTVGAALSESFVDLTLISINNFDVMEWMPALEHVQLLLYLIVTPEEEVASKAVRTADLEVPTPLQILNRMLVTYGAEGMATYLPPTHDSVLRSDGRLARAVERRFRDAQSVWDLVFENTRTLKRRRVSEKPTPVKRSTRRKGKGKARARESDEEGEEVEERQVSEGGWALLSWLVKLWKEDPTSFLQSLPQYTEVLDDASSPLLVVRSALEPAPLPVRMARGQIAAALVRLLVDAASGEKPKFHPHSLNVSLVALLQKLDKEELRFLFGLLDIPGEAEAHVLALTLEERAGTRLGRSESRKRGTHTGFEPGDWGPPTVAYALQLAQATDDMGAVIATQLVKVMKDLRPDSEDWAGLTEDQFEGVQDRPLRWALQFAVRPYEEPSTPTEPSLSGSEDA